MLLIKLLQFLFLTEFFPIPTNSKTKRFLISSFFIFKTNPFSIATKNVKLQHQRVTKKEEEFLQQEEQVKLAIDKNV